MHHDKFECMCLSLATRTIMYCKSFLLVPCNQHLYMFTQTNLLPLASAHAVLVKEHHSVTSACCCGERNDGFHPWLVHNKQALSASSDYVWLHDAYITSLSATRVWRGTQRLRIVRICKLTKFRHPMPKNLTKRSPRSSKLIVLYRFWRFWSIEFWIKNDSLRWRRRLRLSQRQRHRIG